MFFEARDEIKKSFKILNCTDHEKCVQPKKTKQNTVVLRVFSAEDYCLDIVVY